MSNSFPTGQYPLLAAGFVESCSRFPDRPALYIQDQHYTYTQLLEKTEIIFSQLSRQPVPNFVGVYVQESVWTYAAILAILLSGGCYVPLNPRLPAHTLKSILEEGRLGLVISELNLPFVHHAKELIIDIKSTQRVTCEILVDQPLSYLLFTSGTTGIPKGVPVSKKNTAAFFEHYKTNYNFNEQDRFLQSYELSFDVSVFSIFTAWNAGACVYVVPDAGIKYLNIIMTIKEHHITVSSMVPTVLLYLEKYLPEFSFPHLRYSFFSGDKLYHHLAAKWKATAPHLQLHNCYGPTETTIVCTRYAWNEHTSAQEAVNGIVPLGQPFENMEFLVVDEDDAVMNTGIGELCFYGPQVIDAYLNGRNRERFFMKSGKRYYKTGDLVEVNERGNLVFHGRLDAQVKINGYRVELGEVEHALAGVTGKHIVVLPAEEGRLTVLIAFVETEVADEAGWKNSLALLLPAYMVPAKYYAVHEFPKNINGKIDRRQLKACI